MDSISSRQNSTASTDFEFVGITVDFRQKETRHPQRKWRNAEIYYINNKEFQSLVGVLNFACSVI